MLRYSFGNINGKAYGLNANEMSVYEAIGKCSRKDDARGWYADMQTLADQLPHRIGRMTVSRAVDKLLTLGLIRRDGNSLFVCAQNEHAHAQNEHAHAQNEHADAQNEQKLTPPLYPPINNKNEMEKENTRTLVPTHEAAKPQTPDFVDLIEIFIEKGGKPAEGATRAAIDAWSKCSIAKRTKLLAAVREGKFFKPRLDWLISDFPEPQPVFLSGEQQDSLRKQGIPLVQVKYDDKFLICTRDTMNLFGLQWVRDW